MPDEYRIVGTLASFGAETDHKHIKKSPLTLQGNNGAWVTIPGDQYRVERRTGLVIQRDLDDSNNFVDWETYDPEFGGGGWRVTYTVNDNGTQTTYTNEAITFAEEDGSIVVMGSDGAVNAGLLSNALIVDTDLGNETITGLKIANATITATNIANATITATQIANATITGAQIAAATITGGNIAAATIAGSNIASATITGSNIASATIGGSNIVTGTITATQIQDATITGAKIAGATITGSNIAGGTIVASNIATGTITANEIQDLSITASEIANLTITAGQIANATITAAQIANATITGGLIAAATITGSNLAGGTITGSNIAGSTITGALIASATITDSLLANATITGAKIAGATITGSNIAAGTITASNIATGTITATQMTATAIDSMTITGATIRTASSGARTEMNASNLFGLGFGGVGGTDGTTTQWYAKSGDGKIYAGGGNVTLDANGLRMDGGAYAVSKTLSWYSGTTKVGEISAAASGTITEGGVTAIGSVGTAAAVASLIASSNDGGTLAKIYAHVTQNSGIARIFATTHLVFETDAAYDIGASGANRPRTMYLGSKLFLDAASNSFGAANSITVNQGNNNAEAFAVKRTSVAHGMTSLTETDTYFNLAPAQTTSGGANLKGYSASTIGVRVDGYMTTGNTTRGTSAVGAITLNGEKKSGGASAALGANENILAVRDADSTRFLVDKEGDIHMDATSNINAWDDYDDVALLEAFRVKTAGVNFKAQFACDIEAHARVLHDTGVLTLNDDGHHFASVKGLFGLTIDAIRQLARKTERYERALHTLGVDVNQLAIGDQ